jgi:hypothetical protein
MAAHELTAQPLDDAARTRLRQLDTVLADLEELNLNEVTKLPSRVGINLVSIGIDDPYRWTITQLIDLVFDEQAKAMEEIRARPAARFAARRPLAFMRPLSALFSSGNRR